MTKQVKSIVCEPRHNWYLIRFTDGTVKEKYMSKPYKYVEEFMAEHNPTELSWGRFGYYA